MQRSTLTLALTTLLIPSTLAKADTLNFSFHGESGEVPGQVIDETFSLPSSPTPYVSGTFGSKTGFYLEGVDVTGGGLGFESPTAELIFYTDGTIQLNETMDDPDPFLELFGDGTASFTGPVSAPTFHPGTYNILGTYDGSSVDAQGVLTVTDPSASPVPEPSTFVLLGTGLAGAACARRRKLLRF